MLCHLFFQPDVLLPLPNEVCQMFIDFLAPNGIQIFAKFHFHNEHYQMARESFSFFAFHVQSSIISINHPLLEHSSSPVAGGVTTKPSQRRNLEGSNLKLDQLWRLLSLFSERAVWTSQHELGNNCCLASHHGRWVGILYEGSCKTHVTCTLASAWLINYSNSLSLLKGRSDSNSLAGEHLLWREMSGEHEAMREMLSCTVWSLLWRR